MHEDHCYSTGFLYYIMYSPPHLVALRSQLQCVKQCDEQLGKEQQTLLANTETQVSRVMVSHHLVPQGLTLTLTSNTQHLYPCM